MCDEDTAALVVDNGSGMCKVRILNRFYKVIRILKKRAGEMSSSGKVLRTFEFLQVFGAAEKIQTKV